MTPVPFRPLAAEDFEPGDAVGDALLALNAAHAVELSPLTRARFASLAAHACHARRTAAGDAFLLAFDERADYDSPNFLWFRARRARFVYVDRVCVAPARRGAGLARLLYAGLEAAARASGHDRIVCEVNATPPNPVSDAFHAALGFSPVGAATRAGPEPKTVRFLERLL